MSIFTIDLAMLHRKLNSTSAATRTATSRFNSAERRRALAGGTRFLLVPSETIASPETRIAYRIERMLGEGGFGQVFLATRLGRSSSVPEVVCVKASARIAGWLSEAYISELLAGHPPASRLFDHCSLMRRGCRVP